MIDLMELGRFVKKQRLSRRMRAIEAAKLLEVSTTYYSRIENGKDRPSKKLVDRMAETYGLPLEDQRLLEQLAGYSTADTTTGHSSVNMPHQNPGSTGPSAAGPSVRLDPVQHPTLFSDAVFVSGSENGIVLHFAQQSGPMNEVHVVSRIGVNYGHAQKIHRALGEQLAQLRSRKLDS